MVRRALLLINRHARQGHQALERAVEQLRSLDLDLSEESAEHPQEIPDTIRRYQGQVDRVIIGGGDGTLNAAIAGLVDTQIPLAILPLGTANDLARTLQIPQSLPDACHLAATGQSQRIDLGWVNGKYFFNVASLGLSVQITRKLNKEMKRRWGVLAYAMTAFQVLSQSRPFVAEIHADGKVIPVRTVQIAVGNGRYYGGGMAIAADATIDDQRLDLYSLEIRHWWQMLAMLPAMRHGRHSEWPRVRALQGTEFQVFTRRPQLINTDGELTSQTPAQFRIFPQALSVIVPAPQPNQPRETQG